MNIAHAAGEPAADILFDAFQKFVRLERFLKTARPRYFYFLSR